MPLSIQHQSTPGKSDNLVKIYPKDDNFLYYLTSDGLEVKIGVAGEASAGGSNGSVQWNNDGLLDGFGSYDSLTDTVTLENLIANGSVTANEFIGDGSELTGIVGSVGVADGIIDTGTAENPILGYDHNRDVLASMSSTLRQLQSITLVKDGGSWYADVEQQGGGDLDFFIAGGETETLDCTTGSGVGGKARTPALTLGTLNFAFPNFIWIEMIAGTPTLVVGPDVNQLVPVVILGVFTLLDDASTLADGPLFYSRFESSSMVSPQLQGLVEVLSERIRVNGPSIYVGVEGALQFSGASPTNVQLGTTQGIMYVLARENLPAFPAPNSFYIINHPTEPFKKINDLNEVDIDANGDSLIGRRYGLDFAVALSSEGMGLKFYISLPNGSYNGINQAIRDDNGYGGFNIPLEQQGGLVRICRAVLRYQSSGGGTITNVLSGAEVQDRRNWPVGSASGGSGSSGAAAGNDTEIQFNTGGLLDASPDLTWATDTLTLPNLVATDLIEASGGDGLNTGAIQVGAGIFGGSDGITSAPITSLPNTGSIVRITSSNGLLPLIEAIELNNGTPIPYADMSLDAKSFSFSVGTTRGTTTEVIGADSTGVDITGNLDATGQGYFDLAHIGSMDGSSVWARVGHKDQDNVTGYGYRQHSDGTVYLSAPTGRTIRFRENDSSSAQVDVTGGNVVATGTGIFGDAKTGTWSNDSTYARWGDKDFDTATNYGVLQSTISGSVYLQGPQVYVQAPLVVQDDLSVTGSVTSRSLIAETNDDGDLGLQIKRNSATGRSQFALVTETGSIQWRAGMIGAGSDEFLFAYNSTDVILGLKSTGADVTGNLDVTGSGTFGNTHIGTWSINTQYARMGHEDYDLATDYGVLQQDTGALFLRGTNINIKSSGGTVTIDSDLDVTGSVSTDDIITLTTAVTSASASNNSFFRDSGRSNKLSYKGVAGGITTIEP